ncbi:YbaY family lipoprotein [Photorhabdus australis]|uniref:YbaY family lipoprotein n=1 Tax=Photorhabdus australis TaxID=286156 RepID=UPI0022871DFF|nr:YbaY family lipoprotein [Photorhabdus australis]
MKLWQLSTGVLLAVALIGCHSKVTEAVNVQVEQIENSVEQYYVKGNINILQRIALPADAVLTVSLSDVSLLDAPSVTLSQKKRAFKRKTITFPFCSTLSSRRH